MNVLDVLDRNLVKVPPLMHTDKQGVITELVEIMAKAKGIHLISLKMF